MYMCVYLKGSGEEKQCVFTRAHSDDRLYEYNILLFAVSNNDTFL